MTTPSPQKTRRLSKARVSIALIGVLAVTGGALYLGTTTAAQVAERPSTPWFAGYVDVTNTPTYDFEAAATPSEKNVVLSFIVADPATPCSPSWGATFSMDGAAASLDLDRRIARLEKSGGEAIVSFGGLANDELAVACTDLFKLTSAYASVIDRYKLTTIDLDLEGDGLSADAVNRRAQAVAALQKSAAANDKNLAVWLTLPTTPHGLSADGTDAVAAFLAAGVDITGVNAMTMDFGESKPEKTPMIEAVESALTSVHRQLGILYTDAGVTLTSTTLWAKIGATPMIGQNDLSNEVFILSDAAKLNAWVAKTGLARISMWSLNRDASCGTSFTDAHRVSNVCSGIEQGKRTFADALGEGMTGSPQANSQRKTTAEAIPADEPDNPATSPYAIWSEDTTYLVGTKVTWHHNVYEAKWWTRGDLPDDAVLDDWETPWSLIGPVLPGETPLPVPTLVEGTYPEWTGTVAFEQGSRVMFAGIPFEAKWWTLGDSPEKSASDSDNSPWIPLTPAQIQAVLDTSEE